MMQYEICACCGKPKRSKPNAKRFPSHLLLSHDPRCIARGTKRVRGTAPSGKPSRGQTTQSIFVANNPDHPGYADEHGLEEVPAFECVEGCPVRVLGEQSGERNSHGTAQRATYGGIFGNGKPVTGPIREGDAGTAARYFQQFHDPLETLDAPFHYFSKASKRDRNSGLEGMPESSTPKRGAGKRLTVGGSKDVALPRANTHPTCKPTSLISWLCTLITPPGGIILDPFFGSGTLGVCAVRNGFHFIGIEAELEYVNIARARIAHAQQEARHEESEGQEWECVEECPIKVLDTQSGIRKSGIMKAGTRPKGHRATFSQDVQGGYSTEHDTYGDTGGASRYFQQFPPEPVSLWDEEVAG